MSICMTGNSVQISYKLETCGDIISLVYKCDKYVMLGEKGVNEPFFR